MSKGTLSRFSRDEKLEREGIELDLGDGIIITVARAGGSNKKYQAVVRREYKKRKHAVDADLITDEQSREMLAICYADAVVLDWKGVSGEDGKEIKHSRDSVIKVLCDYPEFFDAIQSACGERENFQHAEMEEEAKNS